MSHSMLVTSNRVEGQLVPDDSSRSSSLCEWSVGLADMEQSFTDDEHSSQPSQPSKSSEPCHRTRVISQ
jgi:hypothetical protein